MKVMQTNPCEAFENKNEATSMMANDDTPNRMRILKSGVDSREFGQYFSSNISTEYLHTTDVMICVKTSNKREMVQNITTFTPVMNCSSFALDSRSRM